jgi:hypothetical protein
MGRRTIVLFILAAEILSIGGCSALSMSAAPPADSSLAFTQAAETVVARLTPLPLTQTAIFTVVPTIVFLTTQTPTPTRVPSATPTLAPIGSLPVIEVNGYSYCREGPGDQFVVDAIVYQGDAFTPQGKSADGLWWYVATPKQHRKRPSENCWIASGAVTSRGNVSVIPVVPTPELLTPPPGR